MCEWVNDKNKTHCILSHFLSITISLRVYGTKSTTTLNSNSRWRCIFYKLLFTITTTENECPIAANLTLNSKKKYRKWSFRRRKEKHGCLNVSFPCVCAPPFVLTVILSKARSIYFNDKRLKLMLLQNKICENNLHV